MFLGLVDQVGATHENDPLPHPIIRFLRTLGLLHLHSNRCKTGSMISGLIRAGQNSHPETISPKMGANECLIKAPLMASLPFPHIHITNRAGLPDIYSPQLASNHAVLSIERTI